MSWRPQLNVVCGRCGKPRGLTHLCLSGGNRKATIKPKVSFGKCPRCRKPQGNPLTHTCHPASDFKRRKTAYEREQRAKARAKARKKRQKNDHDYQACTDTDCLRPVCVAFKTGYTIGHCDGYQQGWRTGYDRGFPEGIAACPLPHQ